MVKKPIRLPYLINRGVGDFAGTAPGEDDLGSDRQPQEVARDPTAAGSRSFVNAGTRAVLLALDLAIGRKGGFGQLQGSPDYRDELASRRIMQKSQFRSGA